MENPVTGLSPEDKKFILISYFHETSQSFLPPSYPAFHQEVIGPASLTGTLSSSTVGSSLQTALMKPEKYKSLPRNKQYKDLMIKRDGLSFVLVLR